MIKDFEQLPLNLSQRHPLYDKIIPKNHPLRLINKHIDFSFVTPLLGANYSINYGRSAYSPEVMFKLLFFKILYNLSNECVIQEAQVNMAYRYFLNLEPEDSLMHPSSLTKFRKLRLNQEEILEELLHEVVSKDIETGLIQSKTLIMDATHTSVYYHVDLTRERSVAVSILEGFKGYLHCDGYSGYKNIPGIDLVGCWAHVRRKFFEVPGKSGKAQKALEYCDQIFHFEKTMKGLPPEERQKQRQLLIKPVVEEFFCWLESFFAMKGKLQTAVTYALNQKVELLRFLEDGTLEASNNLAE